MDEDFEVQLGGFFDSDETVFRYDFLQPDEHHPFSREIWFIRGRWYYPVYRRWHVPNG